MKTLVYSGPHDAVVVPDAGELIAVRDVPTEVPNAVAEGLLKQDTWAEAEPAKKTNGKQGS